MKTMLVSTVVLLAIAAGAAIAADAFPADLEKEAGRLQEAARIKREINLHNLYNGLNLDRAQMERIVALARKASDLVEDCFGQGNARAGRVVETYSRILECVRNGRRIPSGLEGMGGLMEVEERGLRKRFFESLAALEAQVWEVLTPAQRDIFKAYQPCLIPPKSLKDPVRVGQADDHEAELEILETARAMPEESFAAECRKILAVYLSGLERLLGRMDPEFREKELDRMIGVCKRARSLPEIEFKIKAQELAASINIDTQKDAVTEKVQEFMDLIRRFQGGAVGPLAKHFLDPLAITILEDRIRRAPEFAAARREMEAEEGARGPGEGCAVQPGQEGLKKKYTSGELCRILGLEGRAKEEFSAVVDRAKRAHIELLQTPMADGRTPLSKVMEIQGLPAEKQQAAMAELFGSLQSQVPGREGSFIEYILRIKNSMDSQFAKILSPAQYSKLHSLVEDILDHIEPGDEAKRTAQEVAAELKLARKAADDFVAQVRKAKALAWHLLSIPGADGKSPVSMLMGVQAAPPEKKQEALSAFLDSLGRAIPGRDTTYAAEVERIKRETMDALRAILSKDEFSALESMGIDLLDLEAD